MNKHIATALPLLLVVGLAGCLLSLTESFEYNVTDRTGPLELAGTNGVVEPIDLSEDSTFEDNQDKLKNIDRVGFEATLYTLNDKDAVISIDFRRDSSSEWLVLLQRAPVSGSSSEKSPDRISYEQSEKLIQNFETFQLVARKGVMDLRIRAESGNDAVTVTDLLMIVTITAGT